MEKKSFFSSEFLKSNKIKVYFKYIGLLSVMYTGADFLACYIPTKICQYFNITHIQFIEFAVVFWFLFIVWFLFYCIVVGVKNALFEED